MSVIFTSTVLLTQLQQQVQLLLTTVEEKLCHLPAPVLQLPPAQGAWSAAQCLEHLNIYSRFYLPRMARAIEQGRVQQLQASPDFRSGWFGNWFTRLMQPKADGSLPMRMRSPSMARPGNGLEAGPVLQEFISNQHQLLLLLEQAKQVDLRQLRVPTSMASWLKLSLGDTFRFSIAHEQRHVAQALRAVGGN